MARVRIGVDLTRGLNSGTATGGDIWMEVPQVFPDGTEFYNERHNMKTMDQAKAALAGLKANGERILVLALPEKEQSKGGIIIPDAAKEKQIEGEVLSVGEGKMTEHGRIPIGVKVGDRVLFTKFAGKALKIDDVEVLALLDADIIAVREA